ncbi:MAG TPA: protein kinase [Pyrinomonadaceae bacterium]|nr:protein kinase [Pyrinomonadaceae bacterium]
MSATLLTANTVLERLGPFLTDLQVLFKAPCSLEELSRINSGVYYGYSQVGKCFTIYPATDDDSVALAARIHELLRSIPGPTVPFDSRYSLDSPVFYRYGAFKPQRLAVENGALAKAIRDPSGNLVVDHRDGPAPAWVSNPFPVNSTDNERQTPETNFRIVSALNQRGKGGVYLGIHFAEPAPRLCILKEGRQFGEIAFDGRDGRWRTRKERKALVSLFRHGVRVPEVLSFFKANADYYLAIEYIEGQTLEKFLKRRKRRLPLIQALAFIRQIATVLAGIHSAGWVWRDCKPANLIIAAGRELRPVDFEGACRIGDRNPIGWGTQQYVPGPMRQGGSVAHPSVDLYALGVIVYYLIAGRFPDERNTVPLQSLRRNIPVEIQTLISQMLSGDSQTCPTASEVVQRLTLLQKSEQSANGAEARGKRAAERHGAEYDSQGQTRSAAPTARNMTARGKREAQRQRRGI